MSCHPVLLALGSRLVLGKPGNAAAAKWRADRPERIPIAVAAVTDGCGFIVEDGSSCQPVSIERWATAWGSRAVLRLTVEGIGGDGVGRIVVTALLADDSQRVVTIGPVQLREGEEMIFVIVAPQEGGWVEAQMAWVEVVLGEQGGGQQRARPPDAHFFVQSRLDRINNSVLRVCGFGLRRPPPSPS